MPHKIAFLGLGAMGSRMATNLIQAGYELHVWNRTSARCSTLSLNWCMQLSRHMTSRQVRFLDAPVVGSRPQAEAHQLIHLVGGDSGIVQQVETVLEASAGAILHIGKPGTGMAMKLAVNALFGIQVAALGELLALLASQGIEATTAAALFAELPVTSLAARGAVASIASGSFPPSFPIKLLNKDLGYGAENINAIAKIFHPTVSGE